MQANRPPNGRRLDEKKNEYPAFARVRIRIEKWMNENELDE